MLCTKCGPGVHQSKFSKSGTICDDCWAIYDMDRFLEFPQPKKGDRPDAKVMRLESGKLGVICPHCLHRVLRTENYYHHDPATSRCPRCMEHYIVKKGEAE